MDTSEGDLVARFAAAEPGGVVEMYRAYGRLVYAVAYRVLDDADLAEQATRQTFVLAWRLAASRDKSIAPGPWLATIATRAAADISRRNSHHRHHADRGAVVDLKPSRPNPSVEGVNDVWQVRHALDALSDQDRELIFLQHYRQLSLAEISDSLAIPMASVKSRSHRAHRHFTGLLGELRAGHASASTG